MLRRLKTRLSYANVVATIALFLVLGGGTALASFVISSNNQVGPNTISGHHPPSGDHANLISGSVNHQDLATGAVNGSKIASASVGTPKFAATATAPNSAKLGGKPPTAFFSSSNVKRISYESLSGTSQDVLTLNGLTLAAACHFAGGMGQLTVTAEDPTTSDLNVGYISSDNAPHESGFVVNSSPDPVLDVNSAFQHGTGTMVLYTEDNPAKPIVTVTFTYEAGNGTPCQFRGIATEA